MADIIVVKMSMNTPLHRMTQCRQQSPKSSHKDVDYSLILTLQEHI